MSDTQGAETGSGGLENDMPAIGSAPPSPRMVPSALGGLADFAQKVLGIGRPAPQAAGPGRSPWQSPGQSQLPVQPQRPPHPDAPRWQGTTASLFLPKGTQQPVASFSPFIGTVPKGDFRNWGQPEEYPNLPQSFEVPGVFQSVGKFFGQQNGPSGPLGLLLAGHTDAYIKGVMQRQQYQANVFREKMLESAFALEEQQRQQHTVYADHGREFFELAGEDRAKLGTIKVKGLNLMDTWHQDAIKMGDTDFANMIENGATYDQLMRFQDYRDARLKDLQKANQKATEQDAEDAAFEGQGTGGAKGQSSDPFAPSQGQAQPQPTQREEPSSAPGPAPTGGPAPQMVASNDPFAPTPDPNAPSPDAQNVSSQPPFNPDRQAAIGLARGDPSDTLPSKGAARGRVLRDHAQIMSRMNDLAARAQGMTPDQIYDELGRNVDPVVAADLRRIVNGAPIPGGWSQVGSRPYWQDMQNMARAIKPGWLPQDAESLRNFELGYNHGVEGQRMMRAAIMGSAGVNLLNRLNEAEAAGDITDAAVINKWHQFVAGQLDDEKWSNVFSAYQSYIQENSAVATAGKPYEGDITRLMQQNPITGGPKIIRGIIKTDAVQAVGALDELDQDYQTTLGRKTHAPHYNEKNVGLLRGLTKLNPDGTFSGEDVPTELKALEKQQGKIPGGWTVKTIQ